MTGGTAQGPGSPGDRVRLTAKDGIGTVAEGGIRGSPMRADTPPRSPARGPGTPNSVTPGSGRRRRRCHGLRGPGRTGWPGRGSGSGPGVEPSAPHLRTWVRPGAEPAAPPFFRASPRRRSLRVSGAILGGFAHFRSCRGAEPLVGGVWARGLLAVTAPPPAP